MNMGTRWCAFERVQLHPIPSGRGCLTPVHLPRETAPKTREDAQDGASPRFLGTFFHYIQLLTGRWLPSRHAPVQPRIGTLLHSVTLPDYAGNQVARRRLTTSSLAHRSTRGRLKHHPDLATVKVV